MQDLMEEDENEKEKKKAGAELCQAQAQLGWLAQAELSVNVEFLIWAKLWQTYSIFSKKNYFEINWTEIVL